MRSEEREAYQLELRNAAKRLGLPARGNLEAALLRHATETIGSLSSKCSPKNLSELLEHAATCLGLEIVEVRDDHDLEALLRRIPPSREPALARLRTELDDKTDAVVLQRMNPDPWDMRYLAIVNCRDWHTYRRYFSKWHELVHLLLEGKQLRLAFRKTATDRKHPEEILVDKIAGELAFFPPLFGPALLTELDPAGRVSFASIERARQRVAPEASRHATVLAAVRQCLTPMYFVRARLGLKKAEERQASDLLSIVTTPPAAKLRVKEASANGAAEALGIRVHVNMEVPVQSSAAMTYEGGSGGSLSCREDLGAWRTSGGSIGNGPIWVESVRRGDEVWCLLHFLPGCAGNVRSRRSSGVRTTTRDGAQSPTLWQEEQG